MDNSNAEGKKMFVGILLFDDVEELDFAGPWEVFGIASQLKNLVALSVSKGGKSVQCRYGLKVQPGHSFANCPRLDLLIVPGGRGAREKARFDAETIAFIKNHASRGMTASVCTGAVVLAEAGLLDGKRATTHSHQLDLLREYPKVQVVENERFIFEENVATSAGISAGIDLSLELLRRKYDERLVREIVDTMEYRV
jgi:transcriptional regulator GlxA family with amidase domain